MKKLLLLLFLLSSTLFGSSQSYEAKIYHLIFEALFPQQKAVRVWVDDQDKKQLLYSMRKVVLTDDINNADLLLLSHKKDIHNDIMKFVTSYKLLKQYKKSAVGGFYWKKGRPNLLFIQDRLRRYNKEHLPEALKQYVEKHL